MKDENSNTLNSKEEKIIAVIHSEGGSITSHEISERTKMAYITVRKYLGKLRSKGIVKPYGISTYKTITGRKQRSTRWNLDYEKLKKLGF